LDDFPVNLIFTIGNGKGISGIIHPIRCQGPFTVKFVCSNDGKVMGSNVFGREGPALVYLAKFSFCFR
jgi:hypothetical protein